MARPKARRQRRSTTATMSMDQLRQRTADAIRRESFQQAREFARTLYKREATAQHHHYLIEATLGRAIELRRAEQPDQAATLLKRVVAEGIEAPEYLVPCLRELMLVGDWEAAETLAEKATDDALRAQVEALQVDAAMLEGEPGLAHVPASGRPAAQTVLQALADLEQGHDTAAMAALSHIPIESPLHDWAGLTQGLAAFYNGSDRALTHWQALSPERAPAAIAAPFRAQIDPTFLAAQPDAEALAAWARQPGDAAWLSDLEAAQRHVVMEEIVHALRRAGHAFQTMPPESQGLRDRLARAVYWLMVRFGMDDDIETYAATFGSPPDDPSLHRLRAFIHESYDDKAQAQRSWVAYEKEMRQTHIVNTEDQALASALIWFHMGEVAAREDSALSMGFPFFRQVDREKPAFDSVRCFRQSAKLAPTFREAHEALMDRLAALGKPRDVVRAARTLIKVFPDHERALEELAEDAFRHHRLDQSVELLSRALRARPHDARLRLQLSVYQLGWARQLAQQGQFDQARAILGAELEQQTSAPDLILCRQAAVEVKAGEAKTAEWLYEQAKGVAISPVVAALKMLIESVRMQLEATWTRRVEREFRRHLKDEIEGPSALEMLAMLSACVDSQVDYEGFETHQRLVFQYLRRGLKHPFSEADLQQLCRGLKRFPTNKLLLDFARRGQREYPHCPEFPMSMAVYHISRDPDKIPWKKADELLHDAEELARSNSSYAELIPMIDALLDVVHTAMDMQRFEAFSSPFDDGDEGSPRALFSAMSELFGGSLDADDLDSDDDDFLFDPWRGPPKRGAKGRKKRSRRKR